MYELNKTQKYFSHHDRKEDINFLKPQKKYDFKCFQ